jgi:hypothetical protein
MYLRAQTKGFGVLAMFTKKCEVVLVSKFGHESEII